MHRRKAEIRPVLGSATFGHHLQQPVNDLVGRTEPATNWSVGGDEAEDAGLVGVEAVIRTVAGSSVENRARMIGETTTVLREVLGTPILPLFVVMEEIAPESWGYNGKTIAQIRADKNK
jgi:phenylpyruvate tautomerase PptA (4-oxalocrotonate tautomerase family)